jgi:excisionase family DNA binding protein
MNTELVTVEEAAGLLRISKWTVRAWLASGRLGRVKIGSRTLLRKEELSNLVEKSYARRDSRK